MYLRHWALGIRLFVCGSEESVYVRARVRVCIEQ